MKFVQYTVFAFVFQNLSCNVFDTYHCDERSPLEIYDCAAVDVSACETVKFCRLEDSPDCLSTDSGDSADVDAGTDEACAKVCVGDVFHCDENAYFNKEECLKHPECDWVSETI